MQPNTTIVAGTNRSKTADLAGWILVALAVSVLLGWVFHVSVLISVVPGLAAMKPNTAAAFLLTGLALLRRDHRDRLCYCIAVLGIGAATLVEYAFNLDLGIDQLLFRDAHSAIDPGRMSPISCVGLILLGPALALMKGKSEWARRISRGLALMAGALGTIALLGYSYDTQALYHVRSYTSVALHTAMGFVIAAIGVQAINPAEGMIGHIRADSAGGAMLRQLLPAALLIPYLLGLAAWIANKRLGWEVGFALALLVAATMSCLVLVMLFNAKRLEREDLARREVNRALEERTALLQAREELLQHTSDELQRVMASISDYLWSAELGEQGKWKYLYYSPGVERITGRPPSFYLQDPGRWLETIHADDRSRMMKAFHRVTTGESEREEEEYRIVLPNGEIRWVRDCATVTRSGQCTRINGVVSDITERKRAEAALRNSEQQLRVLAGSLLTAQEDERRRLSRELHDDITQRLAFLSIELGKLALDVPHASEGLQAKIRELQEQTQDTSTEVRRLSHGLHPSVIEDFGLGIALEEFCSEFEKAQGIRVRFEGLVEDSQLNDASAACLYRVAQEALRNAVTHGHATEVRVTLSRNPDSVRLRVTDNGGGFAVNGAGAKTGLGLVSMRERVRLVNGTLRFSSSPGKGAEVVATVPSIGVSHEENTYSRG